MLLSGEYFHQHLSSSVKAPLLVEGVWRVRSFEGVGGWVPGKHYMCWGRGLPSSQTAQGNSDATNLTFSLSFQPLFQLVIGYGSASGGGSLGLGPEDGD